MKKILVIFTGGTIGSKRNGMEVNVDESRAFYLIDKYFEKCDKLQEEKAEFETIQPINMLSENNNNARLGELINILQEIDYSKYEGVIVTHGSDTLAYSIAMAGYVFWGINIPIIFVASNYELDDERSNGLSNFSSAVDFICNEKIPGIFAIYENDKKESIVYLATRMNEAASYDDQFSGYGNIYYGKMVDKKFILNENSINPSVEDLVKCTKIINKSKLDFNKEVLYIKPFPGLNYDYFDFSRKKPGAILHDLYHSATACTENAVDSINSLADFIRRCKSEGIDVYVFPFREEDEELYATSNILLKEGALALRNITMPAAIMKLLLAYNLQNIDPKKYMLNEIFFEFNGQCD